MFSPFSNCKFQIDHFTKTELQISRVIMRFWNNLFLICHLLCAYSNTPPGREQHWQAIFSVKSLNFAYCWILAAREAADVAKISTQ